MCDRQINRGWVGWGATNPACPILDLLSLFRAAVSKSRPFRFRRGLAEKLDRPSKIGPAVSPELFAPSKIPVGRFLARLGLENLSRP